jgi:hypothetical protein
MKRTVVTIFIALMLVFIPQAFAEAISVGVKPTKVQLEVYPGTSLETEILVFNTSKEPAWYQVYPDKFPGKIAVSPAEFRLDAESSQLVKLSIKAIGPLGLKDNLSIIGRPLDMRGVPAASGVKVPITVKLKSQLLFLVLALLVVFIVVIFVIKLIKIRLIKPKNN